MKQTRKLVNLVLGLVLGAVLFAVERPLDSVASVRLAGTGQADVT